MIYGNGGGHQKKPSSFGGRDSKADGSSGVCCWGTTVQAVVLSSSDSNVPTELVLQHELDCCYHLHSPKTDYVAQCPLNNFLLKSTKFGFHCLQQRTIMLTIFNHGFLFYP